MVWINVINKTRPGIQPLKVKWCDSFYSRFNGLMFAKNIRSDEGLLFNNGCESKANSSIHMLFMKFGITAIWLNKDYQVVDKKICLPWRIYYAPKMPAQYTIETSIDNFNDYFIGDELILSKC